MQTIICGHQITISIVILFLTLHGIFNANGTTEIDAVAGALSITSGTFNANGNLDSDGSISFSGAVLGTLNIKEATPSISTFSKGDNSIVRFIKTNGNQNIPDVIYDNLEIVGASIATKVPVAGLTVGGDLSITSSILRMTNGNIDLEGDFTISTDGTFDPVNNSHNIAGNWNDVDGTFQELLVK